MEGVSFLYSRILDDEGEKEIYKIIDDKNIPETSLALRRLVLLKSGVKIKKLSKATFFISDFIKIAKRTTWFIDSAGKIFQYKKTKSVKLTFKRIKLVLPIRSGGALIEVEGIPTRFKVLYAPSRENMYAGLLEYGLGYIFYGTYPEKLKDTRRMI